MKIIQNFKVTSFCLMNQEESICHSYVNDITCFVNEITHYIIEISLNVILYLYDLEFSICVIKIFLYDIENSFASKNTDALIINQVDIT